MSNENSWTKLLKDGIQLMETANPYIQGAYWGIQIFQMVVSLAEEKAKETIYLSFPDGTKMQFPKDTPKEVIQMVMTEARKK